TRGGPHAHRCVTAIPVYALLAGAGFLVLMGWILSRRRALRVSGIFFSVIALAGTLWLLPRQCQAYVSRIPKETYAFYYDGMRQAIDALRKVEPSRPVTVMTSTINQPYIFYLFYTAYSPAQFYRDRAALGIKPDDNWLYVTKFNRYRFLDPELDAPSDSVVLAREEEAGLVNPIASVASGSGKDWKIVDGEDIVHDAWLEGNKRILRIRKCSLNRSTVAPGEAFQARFMWRCLETPKQDITVALTIEGPEFSWQADHKWWNGKMPADKQSRGRLMPWAERVLVPPEAPAGTYVFRVGIRSDSGEVLRRGDDQLFQEVAGIQIGSSFPKPAGTYLGGWIDEEEECFLLEEVKASQSAVKRGNSVRLTYQWRCLRPPSDNLRAVVNLVCGEHRINFDHEFFDGKRDLLTLPINEPLQETQTITIPDETSPGDYILEVGLWNQRWYYDLLMRDGSPRVSTITLTVLE
ncbi:MAG: hypothetical protein ABIH23_03710, partial [bacterium]